MSQDKFTSFLQKALKGGPGAYVFSGSERFFVDKFCELVSQRAKIHRFSDDERGFRQSLSTNTRDYSVLHTETEAPLADFTVFRANKLCEVMGERYHWADEWLSYLGVEIEPDILKEFIKRSSRDLYQLDKQMRLLSLYPKTLTRSSIVSLISSEEPGYLQKLFYSMELTSQANSLDTLKKLSRGLSVNEIIDALSLHLHRMFAVSCLAEKGASNAEIVAQLSISFQLVKRIRASSPRFKTSFLVKSSEKLASLSSARPNLEDLEKFVIEFCLRI